MSSSFETPSTGEARDRAWIAAVTGGRVSRFERAAGGGSRELWIADVETPDGPVETVLRREAGTAWAADTDLTLRREARVYRALAETEVRVPRILDVAQDGQAFLAERMPGSNDLQTLTHSEELAAVRQSYLRQLVHLHALDPDQLALTGFDMPTSPQERARSWLRVCRGMADQKIRRPVPLLRFAFGWLEENAPSTGGRRVLCHGDPGPGNFLFEKGRVSAVLDWELAHVGDVHDDLATLMLRGYQVGSFGNFEEDLRYYEEVSGTKVDRELLRYYRAVSLIMAIVCCQISLELLDRPDGARVLRQADSYLRLVPYLNRLMADSLADLVGVETSPPERPAPQLGTPDLDAVRVAQSLVEAARPGPGSAPDAAALDALLMDLEATARLGRSVEAADLEEAHSMLGIRSANRADAMRELDERVRRREVDAEAFLCWSRRAAWRHLELWPSWRDRMRKPLVSCG